MRTSVACKAAALRENAPPEFWTLRIFVRLNLLMTLVWCGLMTVNIGIAEIGVIVVGNIAKPVLSFGLPMVLLMSGFAFNNRFPARILRDQVFRFPRQPLRPRSEPQADTWCVIWSTRADSS